MRNSEIYLESVNIRLELDGDDATKFLNLKRKRGLKNNVELARQVLKEAYDKEASN